MTGSSALSAPGAGRQAIYFIGVSTGESTISRLFPLWAQLLELGGPRGAALLGIDLPLDAPPEKYRETVIHLKEDPLALGAVITGHKLSLYAAAGDLFDERAERRSVHDLLYPAQP